MVQLVVLTAAWGSRKILCLFFDQGVWWNFIFDRKAGLPKSYSYDCYRDPYLWFQRHSGLYVGLYCASFELVSLQGCCC